MKTGKIQQRFVAALVMCTAAVWLRADDQVLWRTWGVRDGFAETYKLQFLKQLDLDTLATFRTTWTEGPRTSLKKLERLRAFMRFAEKRKWIDDNPATELKAPKVPNKPTMPFTREEMIRIFAALEPYGKSAGIRNAQRLRAFVLLLRYSGLRIGDATQLEVGRLHGNKVLLHTQKTGVSVYCVLPDVVIAALDAAPRSSERYFFWTGASTVHSAQTERWTCCWAMVTAPFRQR